MIILWNCLRKKTYFWELNWPFIAKTWVLFTLGCFVPSLIEIEPVVLEKIFKFRQYVFTILLLSPFWKEDWNSNSLHPRMHWSRFGWNCPMFLKKMNFKVVNQYMYLLFSYYLPFKKSVVLHLNKVEFPSHKDALCLVWFKLASGSGKDEF